MKMTLALVLLILAPSSLARCQAAPAATAGGENLTYSLRYSETLEIGGTLGNWHTITPSGSVNYSNGQIKHQFTLDYAGGYTATPSGPSYSTGTFQRLRVFEAFDWHKWNATLSDDVSYLPQAPTTGFSGIPGTGEPIGYGSNPPSTQYILTVNTHALYNNTNAGLEHMLNHASTFILAGNYDLLRFPDGNGLDTNSLTANGGLTFRLNARNSLTSQYLYSRFTYPGSSSVFLTNSGMFGFQRQWGRSTYSSVAIGPEWIKGSASDGIPSGLRVSAQASVTYQARLLSAALTYTRATSGGSGYQVGAETDSVSAGLTRKFGRRSTFELSTGYLHNSDLETKQDISSIFGGFQASTRLGRYLTAFVNYTATSQSSNGQLPSNVLTQLMQVVSGGISYSRATRPAH